jgi:hypothetical protein
MASAFTRYSSDYVGQERAAIGVGVGVHAHDCVKGLGLAGRTARTVSSGPRFRHQWEATRWLCSMVGSWKLRLPDSPAT